MEVTRNLHSSQVASEKTEKGGVIGKWGAALLRGLTLKYREREREREK
jgi:hypothetical protein